MCVVGVFPKALFETKIIIFSSLIVFAAQHSIHDAELQEGLKQAEPGEFAASDTRFSELSNLLTVYYN